jgi:hypothetical protein
MGEKPARMLTTGQDQPVEIIAQFSGKPTFAVMGSRVE